MNVLNNHETQSYDQSINRSINNNTASSIVSENYTSDGMVEGSQSVFVAEPQFEYTFLLLVPMVCAFGNSLVVLAVLTNRNMKNCTNFLIMSLAVADLIIGVFVMPLGVYMVVNRLHWRLGRLACKLWCVLDVFASTASIGNLVLISLDRLFAVVRHVEYQTPVHRRRVYAAICFCWLFSLGIGVPLGIGSDDEQQPDWVCGVSNPNNMLYGSIFSFYIPSAVMCVTYGYIFHSLKKRMRAVRLQELAGGRLVGFSMDMRKAAQSTVNGEAAVANGSSPQKWEQEIAEQLRRAMDENKDQICDLSQHERKQLSMFMQEIGDQQHQQPIVNGPDITTSGATLMPKCVTHRRGALKQSKRKSKKTIVVRDWAFQLIARLKSKQGMELRREKRATKLVAIVMVVFFICWLPFFTLNIYKVVCLWRGTWSPNLEMLFIVFTWFGYMNSCLNPVIYSVINVKFRAAFVVLLGCRTGGPGLSRNRGYAAARPLVDVDPQATAARHTSRFRRSTASIRNKFRQFAGTESPTRLGAPAAPAPSRVSFGNVCTAEQPSRVKLINHDNATGLDAIDEQEQVPLVNTIIDNNIDVPIQSLSTDNDDNLHTDIDNTIDNTTADVRCKMRQQLSEDSNNEVVYV